ncbi:hypothetical protein LCGC14_1846930 [marine sediment metagenome]|uniref:Uncharacterized protein n=1 Tax=marine sediment metagenome TaxID=412755 RepID=A0A0F9GZQ6_9ZZZZ
MLSFLLLAIPLAVAASYRQSTTWTMNDITTNTTNCTSLNQIGYGYSKSLGYVTYTNSTSSGTGMNEGSGKAFGLSVYLQYGDTSSSLTNTSNVYVTSIDATSLSAKYVGICFNVSSLNVSASDAVDIDSLILTYSGGGAIDDDTLEGLPMIGSDTGSFLKNLAPGVGAFILIIGIFAAIAAIIYAIVGVVQRKITV